MPIEFPPSNLDPGPWREVSRAEGIRVVEAPNFGAFFEFVNIGFGDADCGHLWRGQNNAAWEITSTLARTGKDGFAHIQRFRDAVARCANLEFNVANENPNADEERLRLWSLGQHHGLASPLIDWTVYPYIALFFAFAEPEGGDSRAVFALNWNGVRSVNFALLETKGIQPFKHQLSNPPYSDEFKRYLFDNFGFGGEGAKMVNESAIPSEVRDRITNWEYSRMKKNRLLQIHSPSTNENRRIHSQGGMQVYLHDNHSVDVWIKTNYNVVNSPWSEIPLLTKVIIPNEERKTVLQCLNKMNVNYLSLFPDFQGAAMHCNLALFESRLFDLRDY